MAAKKSEAQARIKINNLLTESGWRFFDGKQGKANIQLEKNVKIEKGDLEKLGDDFENCTNGFIDYLLLDDRGFPIIVLEAKREEKDPLDAKEQARKYANAINARFIILSNGNLHYLWDLTKGNPYVIIRFPTPESVYQYQKFKPNPQLLVNTPINAEYILKTQDPDYESEPDWLDLDKRSDYLDKYGYRLLRDYQVKAVQSIQKAVSENKDRFLFEMATGTGKTLLAAAVIKLFLSSGNASRVLFLVDRIELENQAYKNFVSYLKNDFTCVIYKRNRDDWNKAKIVISTVQSLADRYRDLFSPLDFDLVISDEAHRSINGNARALFEFFGGYKLGLTATPKDYLKNLNVDEAREGDPRSLEKRIMLDTYKTFGCENSEPTFRYSLLDGVKEGFLLNPIVIDARTDVTTKLLSDEGYSVIRFDEDGSRVEDIYTYKDFERKFFSNITNRVFCETFLSHALRDPVSAEIGKSIIFCISQNHAAKITKILNEMIDKIYPGKYNSDFALQVTSRIQDAQQMTINFQNNNLNGNTRFMEGYKSSKSRVCVTVGMMTTGYDCTDVLNLVLFRPVFSPSEFIQIKGRGTRKHTFKFTNRVNGTELSVIKEKEKFKLFDFFATCEYFETKFDYDEVLELPIIAPPKLKPDEFDGDWSKREGSFIYTDPDAIRKMQETAIGPEGMKVDQMMFERFQEQIRSDELIRQLVVEEDFEAAENYIIENVFERPEDYVNLEKLRLALGSDWRVPFRSILQYIFGQIKHIKGKQEILDEEFNKFININHPEHRYIPYARKFFKAYITDEQIRQLINSKEYARLATNPKLTFEDVKSLNGWLDKIPEYVKDYIPLNSFM